MLTNDDLAAIRERAEKATPGPWHTVGHDAPRLYAQGEGQAIGEFYQPRGYGNAAANAAFIAAARSDVPALLAHIDALMADLKAANDRAFNAENDAQEARHWQQEGDRTDDWTQRVRDDHPSANHQNHRRYATAMKLIGNRQSKAGLASLVCHLIADRDRHEETAVAAAERVDALTAEAARLREMLSNAQAERDMIRQDAMQTAARVAELDRETEQLATAYRNL